MEELTCQQVQVMENACEYMRMVAERLGLNINIFATKNESSGEYSADAIVRISDTKCVSFHVSDGVVTRRECSSSVKSV